mmetsp:Transcript_8341/g.10572  ORF Transcript_8341/g.10572 Transcript_8341/m.10572 type:complete len:127 (+) Transcript_8341:218-598(+)
MTTSRNRAFFTALLSSVLFKYEPGGQRKYDSVSVEFGVCCGVSKLAAEEVATGFWLRSVYTIPITIDIVATTANLFKYTDRSWDFVISELLFSFSFSRSGDASNDNAIIFEKRSDEKQNPPVQETA